MQQIDFVMKMIFETAYFWVSNLFLIFWVSCSLVGQSSPYLKVLSAPPPPRLVSRFALSSYPTDSRLAGFYLLGEGGKCLIFPQKFLLKKKLKAFQILILSDNDIKESVKATNLQKRNFNQS